MKVKGKIELVVRNMLPQPIELVSEIIFC